MKRIGALYKVFIFSMIFSLMPMVKRSTNRQVPVDCTLEDCKENIPFLIENESSTNIRNAFIFNEKKLNNDQLQWQLLQHPLFLSSLDTTIGDTNGLQSINLKLEVVKFRPAFPSLPSQKYLRGERTN
jgi:hypothetical protein